VELKQHKRAERALTCAIRSYSDRYARNRALYRVRLARARIAANEPEGAAESATAALDDLQRDVGSWRVASELHAVARGLVPYQRQPAAGAFLERYVDTSGRLSEDHGE
jgi:hypothetical protein